MTAADPTRPIADLLAMAIEDPSAAEAWARTVMTSADQRPADRSIAHQAYGLVLRERGRIDLAVAELRTALRLARSAADADREADVRATLGIALAMAGRTQQGLVQLDRGVAGSSDPATTAKIMVRRGHVRYFYLAQAHEALADLQPALVQLRATGDRVWEGRTLNLIGLCHLAMGHVEQAADAVGRAGHILREEAKVAESLVTLHNRGWIAFCQGDLPQALELYDYAADEYAVLGRERHALVFDRCQALLAAGLADEAVQVLGERLADQSLPEAQRAELLLTQALAALAADQPSLSMTSASQAIKLFRRQRHWWAARAQLVLLMARHRQGERGSRLSRAAAVVAQELEASQSDDAATAWLLAGRVSLASNREEASDYLVRASTYRRRHSDLVRANGWHALALQREAGENRRGALAACRRGLAALESHRSTFGSSELRALATRHGEDLTTLALRHAVHCGPRVLLEWSERWRATALTQPPVHPPDDAELAQALAALRDTRSRLAKAKADGSPLVAKLDEDRARLERAIRGRVHHLRGTTVESTHFAAGRLVESLDGTTFVELVDIEGVLHALVAYGRRVRHIVVGSTSDAEQAVPFAQFALRQAARGRPADLDDVGSRLERALLGDAVRALGAGPVVISPTARLHAAPWALLPALADVPVTVAPSAALWLRARASHSGGGTRVLVAGPGLESGGAEIDVLAQRHPEAVLLRAGAATVERTLAALDGAAVAHIAAHGRFRDDSPMFSSLDLDDGPLTVHDLERLPSAPHRIVLSACESGVVAPIGAGEMLGLVAAMLAMGSAGVVSSVAQVNDRATADLMLDVHAALDDGADLGTVLLRARQLAHGDRVQAATAAAYLAMGA
jgi:tetratricopeptide (TPR) repeat protein